MEKKAKVIVSKVGTKLTAYPLPPGAKPTRAVIICPGGGYGSINTREGAPVAEDLVKRGFAAFVLEYPIAPARYPQQVFELALAVKHIRAHAKAYNINPKKITVMGFSAGGHLAATLATQWQYDYMYDFMECGGAEFRPDSVVLCYPVITAGAYANRMTFDNLLGGDMSKLDLVSLEKCVTHDCPPTFIWHTVDDDVVPVENALLYISALRRKNISFEAHLFPKGRHGISLATAETAGDDSSYKSAHVASWMGLAAKWIKTL